jgi:hypothetical protein
MTLSAMDAEKEWFISANPVIVPVQPAEPRSARATLVARLPLARIAELPHHRLEHLEGGEAALGSGVEANPPWRRQAREESRPPSERAMGPPEHRTQRVHPILASGEQTVGKPAVGQELAINLRGLERVQP